MMTGRTGFDLADALVFLGIAPGLGYAAGVLL